MTNKERIARQCLSLLAEHGSAGLSTRTIAQHSKVSEALIFKHYGNKERLIEFVINLIASESDQYCIKINASTPSDKIKGIMEWPFQYSPTESECWKAAYKLYWEEKWNLDMVFKPIRSLLIDAFKQMPFANAESEAELVLGYFHGFNALGLGKYPLKEILISLKAKY